MWVRDRATGRSFRYWNEQKDFSYPKALNLGFKTAKNKWIFTFNDHSLLSTNQIFHIATRSNSEENVGGVSGITLPNANATWTELIGTALILSGRMHKPAEHTDKMFLGILPANASLINKEAWLKVGGFNEQYGAGGEDSALAAKLVKAGYSLIVDPALSVHHTHGLGPLDSIRQVRYWTTLNKLQVFNIERLHKFREDLRNKSN